MEGKKEDLKKKQIFQEDLTPMVMKRHEAARRAAWRRAEQRGGAPSSVAAIVREGDVPLWGIIFLFEDLIWCPLKGVLNKIYSLEQADKMLIFDIST